MFNIFRRKKKKKDPESDQPLAESTELLEGQDSSEPPEPAAPEENELDEQQVSEPDPVAPDIQEETSEIETSMEQGTLEDDSDTVQSLASKSQEPSKGLFTRLKSGLSKTRKVLTTDINDLFSSASAIDDDLFEELEERLVTSDLGIDITMEMMERIRKKAKKLSSASELKEVLKAELISLFSNAVMESEHDDDIKPKVIMMVGVNGTGKTTTLGKLATKFTRSGKKVLIAAADTFRAAAIEQVQIWAERAGADLVRHKEGADPAAVAYDAVEASIARGADIVLIDTAGRLHTQKNLMEELKKIKRSVDKKLPGAPHEILLVLDATTGQNAISQARLFHEAVGVTQFALSKLDGTAKGGIVAAVSHTMQLPVRYIGIGEQVDDLQDFDSTQFINALFE